MQVSNQIEMSVVYYRCEAYSNVGNGKDETEKLGQFNVPYAAKSNIVPEYNNARHRD